MMRQENLNSLHLQVDGNNWIKTTLAILNNIFIALLQTEVDLWVDRGRIIEEYFTCERRF